MYLCYDEFAHDMRVLFGELDEGRISAERPCSPPGAGLPILLTEQGRSG